MADLYFDPVEVDTSLAEGYIRKKNINVEEPEQGMAWDFKKKTVVHALFFNKTPSVTDLNQKLRTLSEKLQENSELFCQMEYLMRKTDVDETRNCHLKIISQYLRLEEWNFNVYDIGALSISMGCTLAITEDADIDSAVDVFINSSVQAPWRIERIYVQESVYEQLMEALEMRCTRVASERCVDAFRTSRGRGVECGAGAGAGGGVPVRAYRGARELLALLPSEGGSLSLWCGTAAAAHELALSSPADLVWIDHYAVFDGPPSASLPLYYNSLTPEADRSFYMSENIYTRLLELQRAWIALPLDERKVVVLEVLEKITDDPLHPKLAEDIANWIPADLVDIAHGRITMVIDRPIFPTETVLYYRNDKQMLQLLKSTILGNIIVIPQSCFYPKSIVSKLFDAGVPLTESGVSVCWEHKSTHQIKTKYLYRKKKVIHSRFGTIYAN